MPHSRGHQLFPGHLLQQVFKRVLVEDEFVDGLFLDGVLPQPLQQRLVRRIRSLVHEAQVGRRTREGGLGRRLLLLLVHWKMLLLLLLLWWLLLRLLLLVHWQLLLLLSLSLSSLSPLQHCIRLRHKARCLHDELQMLQLQFLFSDGIMQHLVHFPLSIKQLLQGKVDAFGHPGQDAVSRRQHHVDVVVKGFGGGALWSGTNKNRDVSTGPLARPFTCLLAPQCSLCSAALTRLLGRSLRSLTRLWESEFLKSQKDLILLHSAASAASRRGSSCSFYAAPIRATPYNN